MIPYGHQWIDDDDVDAVVRVLKSDWLTTGPCVAEFEQALCSYTGAKNAIAVNSATSALDIAVQSLDLPRGSEIITTPFTFAATANSILFNGHIPVFADIQRETRNIDPESIRSKITKKTRAIMYVDYAGQPCDIEEIRAIADEYNLLLIEDAAHALGASYRNKKVGTFADITVFSFHPVKPITTAEGGAALTDNPVLAERMRLLRSHGIKKEISPQANSGKAWEYDMVMLGRNYRITDLQAALGISQMTKIDTFISKRNELASYYHKHLKDIPFLELPTTTPGVHHGWHLYTLLVTGIERDSFFDYLREQEIGVNVHYIPTYRFSYYKDHLPTEVTGYPVTEDVFSRIITLPLYPGINSQMTDFVIEKIRAYG